MCLRIKLNYTLLAVLYSLISYLNYASAESYLANHPIDNDAYLGKKDAQIIFVEFSDFNCSYCGRFHTETFPLIKKNYIDTGKLRYVYRDLVGVGGATSMFLASAMECVREQRGNKFYFRITNDLYAHSGRKSVNLLYDLLPNHKVDIQAFSDCTLAEKYKAEVTADVEAARSIGLRGTPGFVIGYIQGDEITLGTLLQGALPSMVFEKYIDSYIQYLEIQDTSEGFSQLSE